MAGLVKLVVVVLYLLVGAAIFSTLERTDEPNKVVASRLLKAAKNNFSVQLGVNITDKEFHDVIVKISEALTIRERRDWTFWRSFDFAIVSLTTIGYGDVTPKTLAGQGVFIIYALIGLPLMLSTLKYSGEATLVYVRKLVICTETKICRKPRPDNINIKCFVASVVILVANLVGGALIFQRVNKICFLEGLYASFVTFSTIGFGDYRVTMDKHAHNYNSSVLTMIIVIQFPLLLFQLTTVSCVINSAIDLMEKAHRRVTFKRRKNRSVNTKDTLD